MVKRNSSNKSPVKSKTKPVSTRLGRSLIQGANEILAHVKGEIALPAYSTLPPVDVKAIREKIGMSQARFADEFALNRRTVQDWECGRGSLDVATRAYLTVISHSPDVVRKAIAEARR